MGESMKKIMALGLAVVFMVSMVLTGCGKGAGTGQEEAGKGGKVKIRFASLPGTARRIWRISRSWWMLLMSSMMILRWSWKPTAVILIPKLRQAWVREMRRM